MVTMVSCSKFMDRCHSLPLPSAFIVVVKLTTSASNPRPARRFNAKDHIVAFSQAPMAKLCIMRSIWTFCPWLVRSQISARCQFPLALQSLMAFWTELDVMALAIWWKNRSDCQRRGSHVSTRGKLQSHLDTGQKVSKSASSKVNHTTATALALQFVTTWHESSCPRHHMKRVALLLPCLDCLQRRSNISNESNEKPMCFGWKSTCTCDLRSVSGSFTNDRNSDVGRVQIYPRYNYIHYSCSDSCIFHTHHSIKVSPPSTNRHFGRPAVLSWPSKVSLQHQSSPSGPQTWSMAWNDVLMWGLPMIWKQKWLV